MRYLLMCCFSILMLSGCASVEVSTELAEGVSFNGLKTYAWLESDTLPGENVRVNNPEVVQAVRAAVDKRLLKRGYAKDTSGSPDFQVTWFGAIEKKVKVESIDHFYSTYGYGAVVEQMPKKMQEGAKTREYEEGTIIIDFLNPMTHKRLLRGSGTDRLLKGMDKTDAVLYINRMVDQILRGVPPATS